VRYRPFSPCAFAADDVKVAVEEALRGGWNLVRGPSEIPVAKAKSAFLDRNHFEFQVLEYKPNSPDLEVW
jgi:hypothetical protein